MKKLAVVLLIPAFGLFYACNSAQHKPGNNHPDTDSTRSNLGAIDTINGSAAPFAQSTAGTDTSTDGQGVTDPLADTVRPKKHK